MVSINLIHKSLVSSLYSTVKKQQFEISDNLIPADFFVDADEKYLPDSVFKYLIYLLYQNLTSSQFIHISKNLTENELIPLVSHKMGTYSNLNEALKQHSKAITQLLSGSRLDTHSLGDDVWLIQPMEKHKIWNEAIEVFSILYMKCLLVYLTGNNVVVQKVALSGSNKPQAFDQDGFANCTFFLNRSHAGLAVKNDVLKQQIKPKLKIVPATQDETENPFIIRFRMALSPYVNFGRVPIGFASELLNIEERSLQRALSAESTSYSKELDRMIFEKVKSLLENTNFTITDIAGQFNYTDSSNFARAFKKYAGVSPKEYRNSMKR